MTAFEPMRTPHADGTCEATRCGSCHDDENRPECDACGEEYDVEDGCLHGLVLCRYCMGRCPECWADAADDASAERVRP